MYYKILSKDNIYFYITPHKRPKRPNRFLKPVRSGKAKIAYIKDSSLQKP
jgi:hypothetical protein